MIKKYLAKLCGQLLYHTALVILEVSCVLLWLSGKFLNTEIDTFHSTTLGYEKYVITLQDLEGGD
jgi:hypothetical protein